MSYLFFESTITQYFTHELSIFIEFLKRTGSHFSFALLSSYEVIQLFSRRAWRDYSVLPSQ